MILLGGINGVGKTTLCKALEKYGLKCSEVSAPCYDPRIRPLAYEVMYYGFVAKAIKGDVVDESPLTVYLYINAIQFLEHYMTEEEPEELKEISEGVMEFAKRLKKEDIKFVWLTAPSTVILDRLRKSACARRRPVLESVEVLTGLLKEYEMTLIEKWKSEGMIDLVLDTSTATPEELAARVVKELGVGKG